MAKKLKVQIKTDGTLEGTTLMVNGSDITKTQTVTRVYFSAYAPSDERDRFGPSDEIYLSWDVIEENEEGVTKTVGYRLDVDGKQVYKGIGKKIGDSAELQFENISDANAYAVTKSPKKLEDVVKVTDLDKKEKQTEE